MKKYLSFIFVSALSVSVSTRLSYASLKQEETDASKTVLTVPKIENQNNLDDYLQNCRTLGKPTKLFISSEQDTSNQSTDNSFYKIAYADLNLFIILSNITWDVIYQDGNLEFNIFTNEFVDVLYKGLNPNGKLIITNTPYLPVHFSINQNHIIQLGHFCHSFPCVGSIEPEIEIEPYVIDHCMEEIDLLLNEESDGQYDNLLNFFNHCRSIDSYIDEIYTDLLQSESNSTADQEILTAVVNSIIKMEKMGLSRLNLFMDYLFNNLPAKENFYLRDNVENIKKYFDSYKSNRLNQIQTYGKTKKFLENYFIDKAGFKNLELFVNPIKSSNLEQTYQDFLSLATEDISLNEFMSSKIESIYSLSAFHPQTAFEDGDQTIDTKEIKGFFDYFKEIGQYNQNFPMRKGRIINPIYLVLTK